MWQRGFGGVVCECSLAQDSLCSWRYPTHNYYICVLSILLRKLGCILKSLFEYVCNYISTISDSISNDFLHNCTHHSLPCVSLSNLADHYTMTWVWNDNQQANLDQQWYSIPLCTKHYLERGKNQIHPTSQRQSYSWILRKKGFFPLCSLRLMAYSRTLGSYFASLWERGMW